MIYGSINLMLPSRKRIAGLTRLINSALSLSDDPGRIRLTILADADDLETIRTVKGMNWNHKHLIIDHDLDGPHLSRYYNRLYYETHFDAPSTIVTMLGDDMYFDTKGWDSLVLDEINRRDGKALVFGDDCLRQHGNMAVNIFTTRIVVGGTGTGEFMWSRWRANMIDVVWTEIAKRANILSYLPKLRVVHDHNSAKRPEDRDDTHRRLSELYTFATGKWNILNPYIDKAVASLRQNGVAQ